MGICSSCLGLTRQRDLSSEDENSRLLFDDPHTNHYGSFGDQGAGTVQADPQEVLRENEALQKVVAQTSNHLVDIFAVAPQSMPSVSNTAFAAQDSRILRYREVLAKLSASDQSKTLFLSTESTSNLSDGWMSEEDGPEEPKGYQTVRLEKIGPLLGGFADAETRAPETVE